MVYVAVGLVQEQAEQELRGTGAQAVPEEGEEGEAASRSGTNREVEVWHPSSAQGIWSSRAAQ